MQALAEHGSMGGSHRRIKAWTRLGSILDLRKMFCSVFYYHRARLHSTDKFIVERDEICAMFCEYKGRYGYRRITAEMTNRGYTINHKTIRKIMAGFDLKCRIRKVRYRSYKGEVWHVAPNVICRDFRADAPHQKWATDVTQINIKDVKLCMSPIIDMFNGEIVAHNISKSPNLEQVYDMLDNAFSKIGEVNGLMFHSDQGWQYQHFGYGKRLDDYDNIKYVKEGRLS